MVQLENIRSVVGHDDIPLFRMYCIQGFNVKLPRGVRSVGKPLAKTTTMPAGQSREPFEAVAGQGKTMLGDVKVLVNEFLVNEWRKSGWNQLSHQSNAQLQL